MMRQNPAVDPLATFEWQVADGGYRWIHTKLGQALTPRLGQPGPPRFYRPFTQEHAGLFSIFARLTEPEEILAFANQYGALGLPLTRERTAGPFEYVTLESPLRRQNPPLELDHCWAKQILRMRGFLNCARFSEKPDEKVWTAIQLPVNKVLQQTCAPRLSWTSDPVDAFQFRLDWSPHSLLGALWLQAVRSVTRPSRFQQCASCGRIMEISREKMTGARADARLCSQACRAREYRKRKQKAKQLSQQGWPPGRIAKQLGTKTATVRGWVKKGPR